jgi:hypothetical protein
MITMKKLLFQFHPFAGDNSLPFPHAIVANDLECIDPYNKNLCSWLSSDCYILDNFRGFVEHLEELERGERELVHGGGDAWFVTIYRDRAEFELQAADGHAEWPVWKCSYAQLKAASLGWLRFLEMPRSLETTMEIELPEQTA